MARFDVFSLDRNFVLDFQSDLLEGLSRRVVVPLLSPSAKPHRTIRDLNPVLTVEDQMLIMATELIASVPRRVLGRARGNLADYRDDITRALDMLFTGF